MTLLEISDKLFFISLIILIAGVLISGVGPHAFFPRKSDKTPGEYEKANKGVMAERQDKALARLVRSKVVWVGLVCLLVSIVLSLF